ncbi:hypothetical protein JCM11491_000314 [Sporobolomyces phaffii]
MSGTQPRTSLSSRSNRDDVLQFLDSLDAYSGQPNPAGAGQAPPAPAHASSGLPRSSSTSSSLVAQSHPPSASGVSQPPPKSAQEAQSVLDFLDEITSKTTSPPPPPRTSTDRRPPSSSSAAAPNPAGGMRTATSRSNLSQIAQGASTTSPAAASRKSTDSVRSQRSATTPASTSSPAAAVNRTLPTFASTATAAGPNPRQQTPPPQSASAPPPPPPPPAAAAPASAPAPAPATGGWGWSSVWSTASTAITQASHLAHQARTAAEEQVKANAGGLGEGLMKAWNHDDAATDGASTGGSGGGGGGEGSGMKKWTDGVQGLVKGANLEGLGKELKSTTLKSLTDLLNAVAPPIAEHEVIEVSLSHDMKGYDGVETLVYRGLSKVMDQIEGGTLMVNRAKRDDQHEPVEDKAETARDDDEEERDLGAIEGMEAGWTLAQTTLDRLIASTYKPAPPRDASPSSVTVPVTTCPVYLRLQPVLAPLPNAPQQQQPQQQLYFVLVLIDPTHALAHHTVSQALPARWLDVPFAENEWVEQFMVDAIRGATEVVGQEYIAGRMRAQSDAIEAAKQDARKTLDEHGAGPRDGNERRTDAEEERQVSTMSQEARVGIV